MSVLIRDRERVRDERDWDDRSSTQRDSARGPTTTVKYYRVPREDETTTRRTEKLTVYNNEADRRSTVSSVGRGSRDIRGYDETRIIRRDRTPEPEPERRYERDIRIERIAQEREPEPERRYERDVRIERYDRELEPRRFERDYRYEHDYERLPPRREPYELERYSKSTEYFRPEPPPQPIIIRQEPQQIIIQEAPRAPIVIPAPQREESDYQLIQRSEVTEDRQVARREPEKEYYYEKRTREVTTGDRDDDFVEERYRRRARDVSPGDSASQHGRDDYSSDESIVYIRKETYGRDESPHHKRHLAEGALAGLGAAELLRHHHKKEDKDVSGTGGRIGKDVGAAALGAVAATGLARARSHRREKSKGRHGSRSRSRSRDREGRRKHRHRDRSRSRSKSRVRQLVGVGLGAAALAGAIGYANRNKNGNDKDKSDRRSRSRTRRHSASEAPDDARNPSHRNKRVAQATLAGATVAGLVERARSRSRSRRGKSRSKSRLRTGVPIAAAGLGSAAIAGLYEKSKAKKAEKEDKASAGGGRARRRDSSSRSRERSRDRDRSRSRGDPRLIEYGDEPVYSRGPDYFHRPESQAGYYAPPSNAMVPAAAAIGAAAYDAGREDGRAREHSITDSDSERRRRRRHRRRKSNRDDSGSRNRAAEVATAGLAAGAATLAAAEHEKRKQRKKEEKRERRRRFPELQPTITWMPTNLNVRPRS